MFINNRATTCFMEKEQKRRNFLLILLHPEQPKLLRVLAVLSAVGLSPSSSAAGLGKTADLDLKSLR